MNLTGGLVKLATPVVVPERHHAVVDCDALLRNPGGSVAFHFDSVVGQTLALEIDAPVGFARCISLAVDETALALPICEADPHSMMLFARVIIARVDNIL